MPCSVWMPGQDTLESRRKRGFRYTSSDRSHKRSETQDSAASGFIEAVDPMAEPYLGQLKDLVDDLELDEPGRRRLECRHFFSGAALYADGRICASLTAAGLAVKLPLALHRAMLKDGRGRPLRYFDGGNVKKGYVVFSEAVAADPSAVRDLFERSFRHVRGE